MGYFDHLVYIGRGGGGGQKSRPSLTLAYSYKTWYNYNMRYEFFKFSKIIHDVVAIV